MSDAPKPYVVRQGDSLSTIAQSAGVEPDAIWTHAKNADLAKLRDPDILAPGDILYVPPKPPPSLQVTPQSTNSYQAKVPEVSINVMFVGEKGPLRSEAYVIKGLGDPIEGSLDGTGGLALKVPAHAKSFNLVFPQRNIEHTVLVRHLDPIEEASGVQARLTHLGFKAVGQDSTDPFSFVDEDAVRRTIAAFQKANGLPASGVADTATKALLTKLHGC